MPIDAQKKKFEDYIARRQEAKLRAAAKTLEYVGLKSVAEMRTSGRYNDYTDRTGNLRSSTGFAVVLNGKQIAGSHFTAVSSNAHEGSAAGKAHAEETSSKVPNTKMALVIVAGMEYAEYLDNPANPHGRNVMTTTKELAKKEAEKRLTQIGFKVIEQ